MKEILEINVYDIEKLFKFMLKEEKMDGREIILKIKSGNTDIFSDIIEEYSGYLAKVINNTYRLNTQDTEDIISETLFSLWKSSKKLKEDLNFKSYLATIARNKTIDFVRKRRQDIIELDINLSDGYDIENDILIKEMVDFINQKMEETKEPDRSILCLKYHYGLKSKEIADKLSLNQNIVDIRLCRQRSKFKKMLLRMEV